jgi:AAA domain
MSRQPRPARDTGGNAISLLVSQERAYSLSVKEGWFEMVDAPTREQPPAKTIKQLAAMTDDERLRYNELRAVWHANLGPIETPQLLQVHEDLWEIVDSNRQDGDRVKGAASIDAHPGLGKTTIAVAFGREFHHRQIELYGQDSTSGDQRIPVAYLSLTGTTTMWTLNSMLCRFYAHPGAESGNATQLAGRAADCVLSCDTKLVIIDDVHFLDMNRQDSRAVANHFKWLANQFPTTFVFVGVGLADRGLLTEGLGLADAAYAQTGRRWTPLSVGPFEIHTEDGRETWRRLLLGIERMLVLANKHRGMVADDLADYLYARSTGHFASLMTLVSRGCHRAIKSGEERLTVELLDHVKNDAAAEQARRELMAAFGAGRLTARPRGRDANAKHMASSGNGSSAAAGGERRRRPR